MKPICLIGLLTITVAFAHSHTALQMMPQMSSDEAELNRLDKEWAEAEVRGNTLVLNRIWADNFLDSSSAGERKQKRQMIADHTTGRLTYKSITPETGYQTVVSGNTATISYRAAMKGQYNGHDISGQYRIIHAYVKRHGSWQALASYKTLLTEPHAAKLGVGKRRSTKPVPLPTTIEPYAALKNAVAKGSGMTLRFRHTDVDSKASARAQVFVRGQTLLVRLRAKNLPPLSRFKAGRYTLWAYLPNYKQRIYLGDLPVTPMTKWLRRTQRTSGDSAFRFTALPRGAVFGGLMLTAERAQYVPLSGKPSQLLLVALTKEGKAGDLMSAPVLGSPSKASSNPQPTSRSKKGRGAVKAKGRRRRRRP